MKPKFALDLSHEGINLLHRSKGGWTLVGSVDLDDPEMGRHLADLRRAAAQLESGGFTCKIIIPNSQILYTTLEAPGPDDIAREVQIRSGLDGLTPYPVGELVFDWRAAGERARVAVLARDTMDEAETFAVEHRFNPVSFVARPPQGEFSGEPFFGKTRAATKILGPTERVEPDASPVPRRPRAAEQRQGGGAAPGPAPARAPVVAPAPAAEPVPHAPGALAWQPPSEPSRPNLDDVPPPRPRTTSAAAPSAPAIPEPLDEPVPGVDPAVDRDFDPIEDKFAELDALQAELSGDLDSIQPFRPRSPRPEPSRAQPPARGAEPAGPPPLAPFPPTSDDAETMPAPGQPGRKARGAGKAATEGPVRGAAAAARPASSGAGPTPQEPAGRAIDTDTPAAGAAQPRTERPATSGAASAALPPDDDVPAAPGVAFSTRRSGSGSVTTATPSARGSRSDMSDGDTGPGPAPRPAPGQPAATGTRPQPTREARKDLSPVDRRRADMADALSRPLPGGNTGSGSDKASEAPAKRGALSGAMRGAAGGLRSFAQRRTDRKSAGGPDGSSMAELMRGAGSSGARISPDPDDGTAERTPGGDRLDRPADRARADASASTPTGQKAPAAEPARAAPEARARPAPAAPATSDAPDVARTPARTPSPARPEGKTEPVEAEASKAELAPPSPAAPSDAPALPPKRSGAKPAAIPAATPPSAPASLPGRHKTATGDGDTFNVFGARRAPENTARRKYLGLVLTLLLLLAMAVIGLWSSFVVDDGDPALFNPADTGVTPDVGGLGTPQAPAEPDEAGPGDSAAVADAPAAEPDTGPAEADAATTETRDGPAEVASPQVLSQDEAEARYAETQVWQRAPDALSEPFAPGLDIGAIGGPGTARGITGDPDVPAQAEPPAAPAPAIARADPLPPPPADTIFQLNENGLVAPSPDGTVSPSGIVIYEGAPTVLPPARPEGLAPVAIPEAAVPAEAALDAAVEEALEGTGAGVSPADAATGALPDAEATPLTDETPAVDPATPDAGADGPDARLDPAPGETPAETPADPATEVAATEATDLAPTGAVAVEGVVDVVATTFVDASELAVATSLKPTRKPADIDQIVEAAMAAQTAPAAAIAAPDTTATTTPAIPTSANVANQATTTNAIDLREINLLGISGPSNARRALVRMENGRYVTVKVGDRLDGGRVTSITDSGLTYQKGSRNYSLQLLPLG